MKILITGGTGFIGKNLVSYLKNKGYEVFLLIQKHEIEKIKEKKFNAILWKTLLERTNIEDIYGNNINKIDITIHLASYGVNSLEKDLDKMLNVNINLSLKLVENLYKLNCNKIILTGSGFEYKYNGKKLTEEDLLYPNTLYSAAKSSSIALTQSLAKIKNIKTITLRLFNIFGEHENKNRLLPSLFLNKDKNNIPFTFGEQIRDFLYIQDVVSAYEKVLLKDVFDDEIYNICSSKETNIHDFIILAAEKIGIPIKNLKFGEIPYREGEPMYIVGENRKFSEKFNWKQEYSLSEGVELMYKNYGEENEI
ncbi:NAD(P)-dependent oxidoreductase [uncultured Fusobacterium sp.]|uniref:NAD-dependent epimerase/dehydratase family protein n=1 Tax=uncultured Fusobacterium sp. TaxID=159267 RepID=UPI00265EAE57|nr:NAD(P)-dependent oxidoreductase [uncultured Fusobacterium sp.]